MEGLPIMRTSFRDKASYGKRVEYMIISKMLMEGMDVYVPLVDDHGVDCVVKKADGTFVEVQIKATSKNCDTRYCAMFSAIWHEKTPNYYFVFYSETLDTIWLLSSEEFVSLSSQSSSGKNKGQRAIQFNGCRTDKNTKEKIPYCSEKYKQFICTNFDRIK